ncbi:MULTISPECIES: helix-turn-helix transcriptional regulator [Paraburkholderia]|uniref:Helix-turn-helix domain-containing protein n=2 Tax=Paraburkholderia TaxID=1822464 RepID=A0A1I3UAE3_9BURK|nr:MULTISPECIES: helix-turn-helix transcriptional regulator [Paraburkholderia]MCX4164332.1 helix-turn-helix transcriptional regulator [Paraburkholderia megapolitana]MDN7159825.1 helix-turn-helix domain-containing protein [Paraburkholderia sp. CHISQ3]MDQ6496872.1 helix-turn-helix domain-containing protein [Paraburkholderia megapolitana]PCE26984.1 transcriptional regulator [Paraburkholderia acidicola]QDQ83579.1 helix-turn-helix domain-containing protein [Paraburkholderia megapolitana]
MSKLASRPLSRYSLDAALLLGQQIRRMRIERTITTAQMAERAGLSRSLVQRIEKGDPSCSIGAVFEAAAVVGLRLFDADQPEMTSLNQRYADTLILLPKKVRTPRIETKDDF